MPTITPRVEFNNADLSFTLKRKRKIRQFIQFIFTNEKQAATDVNYVFCSDEYLLRINRDFLHHDDLTDIITFNLAEPDKPVMGEIYISVERVRENARIFQTPPDQEIMRVMFHGALHLCGYKDKTTIQKQQMTVMEDFYLGKFANA